MLIRSTLSSLPIYYLSLFRILQKVCARLERIQRQFRWGGSAPEKKISLVRWVTVCSEKRKWGIGLKSLSKLNKALLCKWSWRFANDQNALWRKVICCKFGESIGAGIPVTLEVAMGLVYGRKSEKNGSFSSRTRPLFLGMEGGSISGAMFGVVGRP